MNPVCLENVLKQLQAWVVSEVNGGCVRNSVLEKTYGE
jgi:hypothetical protein